MSNEKKIFKEPYTLLDLLNLEQIEKNFFRGKSRKTPSPQLYGGQVLGQALLAACQTVENLDAHSVHCYFLRGGDMKAPVLYEVEITRDGRSFASRRVMAIQHGRPIFTMSVSFQQAEEGLEHQVQAPDVPPPEGLEDDREFKERMAKQRGREYNPFQLPTWPFEIRRFNDYESVSPEKHPPEQMKWVRLKEKLPDDVALHKSALAYMTDFYLMGTAMQPHEIDYDASLRVASLDHAIWFHRDFRIDDWLLYTLESPSASGGRGFSRGQIYDRAGRLVASCCQEGLMRVVDE